MRAGIVCLGMVVMLWIGGTLAFAQGRFTDVLVPAVKNKVIAITGVGQSEIDLEVGETVVSTKAHGLTALAITSARLLGFSFQLRHWGEQTLEIDEHVNTTQVLRELCVVATDQHLYGFQGTLAHWASEAFCIKTATGFCPYIQVGVLRLDSMAWQLAARDGRVAVPASGLRREGRVALNCGPCPGIECRCIEVLC